MNRKFTPELQQRFVEDTIRKWIPEAERILRQAIHKRKEHIPEETMRNIRVEFLRQAMGEAGAAIRLQDSGRIVDMRRVEFDKNPITRQNNFMLDWARKHKARLKRLRVPGYKNGEAPNLTEDEKMERIASAMIFSKGRGRSRKRRGRWYNKAKLNAVNLLYSMLVRDQSEWLMEATKDEVRNAFSN